MSPVRGFSPILALVYPAVLGLVAVWGTGLGPPLGNILARDLPLGDLLARAVVLLPIAQEGKQLFSALAALHVLALLLLGAYAAPARPAVSELARAGAWSLGHTAGGALLLGVVAAVVGVGLVRLLQVLVLSVGSTLLAASLATFFTVLLRERRRALARTYLVVFGLIVVGGVVLVFIPAPDEQLWPPTLGEALGYMNPLAALRGVVRAEVRFLEVWSLPTPAENFLPGWEGHLGFVAVAVLGLVLAARLVARRSPGARG